MGLNFFLGIAAGFIGLMGLSLSNGLLACHYPLLGAVFSIALASLMAYLAATSREKPDPRATGAAMLTTGILGWLLAGPNPSFEMEFGVDRYLLLPQQMRLLQGVIPWERNLPDLILALIATAIAGVVVVTVGKYRKGLALGILGLMVGSFWVAASHMNPVIYKETDHAPVPHEYIQDGFLYLRVRDLMQQGQSVYQATYTAYVDRQGETGTPSNWLNWRPPMLYFLWLLVPGGPQALLVAFWFLIGVTLIAAFYAVAEIVGTDLALGAPALLGAYFLYGADTFWFSSQEWWSSSFMILGFCAFLKRSPALGSALWALAMTSREHFIFLMPVVIAMAALDGRRARISAAVSSLFVIVTYLVHYYHVAAYVTPGNPGINAWRDAGPNFIYLCSQFSSVYLAGRFYGLLPLAALGTAGALTLRDTRQRVMLAGSIACPLLAYLFIGQVGRYYWGVVLMPQVLLCVPLAAGRLLPKKRFLDHQTDDDQS